MEYKIENITVAEESLELHPLKAIFWKKKNTLIIADVHVGKVTHFINAGIPLPGKAAKENFERLNCLLNWYKPKELIVIGDLFHSAENDEWLMFSQFIENHPETTVSLVMGNHEILEKTKYKELGLAVYKEAKLVAPFIFSHEPLEAVKPNYFCLAGHIHPGVKLNGNGLQSLRLPCFYFSKNSAILPAFGTFTGKHTIKPTKKDKVFVVTEKAVLNVSFDKT